MTANEIMSEILDSELYDEDDVRACTFHNVKATTVRECMYEWGNDVVDRAIKLATQYGGSLQLGNALEDLKERI